MVITPTPDVYKRQPLASAICIEELSKQCASTGDIVATHNGLCCDPILTHGTEEQKAKYLPMLTTGHKVGAFALTEPNAGSDASKGQTEAKLEGDHYVTVSYTHLIRAWGIFRSKRPSRSSWVSQPSSSTSSAM